MTKLRAELIKVFNNLSSVESTKGREFPSRAFKSVANALEKCDHYIICNDRVTISNPSTGFIKVLGSSSSAVFIEYINNGTCSRLDNEPIFSSDLNNINGIGNTKKLELIKAGINSINDLNNLNLKIGDNIPGTNLTYTSQINTGIILWNKTHGVRISREQATEYVKDFKNKVFENIYVLGSYRRLKPTVGDIDIVIVGDKIDHESKIINWLDEILVNGNTKIAGIKDRTQVDIRIIDKKYLGAHILHATGSQEFNIKLRAHAKLLGMKLNEYGIYDKNNIFHTFVSESEIFNFLGLDYVPPELR